MQSETDKLGLSFEKISEEIDALNKKIEQLQYHNFTLATLVADLIDGKAISGSIQELSVLLDLTKEDLRISHKLISSYDGNIDLFNKKFINSNGNLSKDNMPLVVQAYKNSGAMIEKCEQIITDSQDYIGYFTTEK